MSGWLGALACGVALALIAPAGAQAASAGVQAHLLWSGVSRAEVNQQLNVAKAAGARYVRVDVGWSTLEPKRDGQMNRSYLSKIGRVVRAAEARGLRLVFTFWTTPCWASSAPESLKRGCRGEWWERGVDRYPPRRAAHYADALSFLVERYRGRVSAWEIWNEPNLDDFFKSDNPAADYARLLRVAYPAAKRAHRRTTVLGGSLAGADFRFTGALFNRGVKDRFDAWSIHPYSHQYSPLHPRGPKTRDASFIRGVPAVRRVLVRRGDPEPLWLTEFGWSTCTVRGHHEPWENCVDETTQAEYLTLAYDLMKDWSYVDVGVWYNLQNTGTNPADRLDNFGLLRFSGAPKPAYAAFSASSANLRMNSP